MITGVTKPNLLYPRQSFFILPTLPFTSCPHPHDMQPHTANPHVWRNTRNTVQPGKYPVGPGDTPAGSQAAKQWAITEITVRPGHQTREKNTLSNQASKHQASCGGGKKKKYSLISKAMISYCIRFLSSLYLSDFFITYVSSQFFYLEIMPMDELWISGRRFKRRSEANIDQQQQTRGRSFPPSE